MAGLTYKSSGVDIEKGDNFVESIKKITKNNAIGMFGNIFEIGSLGMKNPVLVSGTDGVGTKLKLAYRLNKHDTIGIDLVAMCVNDILCHGAKPLYFLDYLAHSNVEMPVLEQIIIGINEGCKIAGCELAGGETAEMPNIYQKGEYDLAGFAVGAVEKENMLPKNTVAKGDFLIAVPSSGVHSNGFSLVNKILEVSGENSKELLERLMTPTRIYVKEILNAMYDANGIKGYKEGQYYVVDFSHNNAAVKYFSDNYQEISKKSDHNNPLDNIKNPGMYSEFVRQWIGGLPSNSVDCIASHKIFCTNSRSQEDILCKMKTRYGKYNNSIKALAHITGGGLYDNAMRVVPQGLDLEIDWNSIKTPEVLAWLQKAGGVETAEMRQVFNMGVGMVIFADEINAQKVLAEIGGSYVFGKVK
jgi:phosphoribosylaminoimidazole (AIR) synthetase